ncbi:DUF4920 domain-containing protein [Pseudoalteromonas rubra]|uniref:DUF4920 domain-containing protein n=1 Tax=Pseudoalteromonas rubra TaxID=43658 RepID=A0A4Q7E274_9GAMM|nr:DUF4920 domain-containing protein [Pseudoalteromonas rubra]RZM71843.1 DUF4920 domain-containing protein [Pseudoalteromonas rubra]
MLIRTMLGLLAMVCAASAHAQPMEFAGGADKTNVIDAPTLLAKASQYHQTQVTVKGLVTKVCKNRGCWMTLEVEKGEQITVKVRDGDMVFPMSAVGKTALATGKFEVFELSIEKSRRYLAHKAEENGEAFDPQTLKNPITVYRLKPSAVTIL